ncbi:MAG: glycosyltransferase, partial [Candidatus Omnitrophica bacterium]|nr:glycosyltransferase [Candidatus Omnitrophota bacterium]
MDGIKSGKLYFLINSLAGGGAERVVVNISKPLAVDKIFLLERDIKYEVDIPLDFLSSHSRKTSAIYKTLYIPLYALRFAKRINKNDIVVSFLERANFVNLVSKFFKPHKTIISVHIFDTEFSGLKSLNKIMIKLLYPKADIVITVSKGIAHLLEKKYKVPKEKIYTIYNPINIEKIQEMAKEPLEMDFGPLMITVGRLSKQKGHWHLLRIFKEIKKEFSEYKLLIVGEGEL